MSKLDSLRKLAATLQSRPSSDKLDQFIDDFDSGRVNPSDPADIERIRYFDAMCTHVRGYQDLYVEGLGLVEWCKLLGNTSKELRDTFEQIDFADERTKRRPRGNKR